MILPFVIGTVQVECCVGGKTDGRILITEVRCGIIEMPLIVEVRNIGCPKIYKVRVDLSDPGRLFFKDAPAEFPSDLVFGTEEGDTAARREHVIGIPLMCDRRIMRTLDKSLWLECVACERGRR